MRNTITAIKRGVKAAVAETLRPRKFEIGGKPVICSHCGGSGFQWHGYGVFGSRRQIIAVDGFMLECCDCSHVEIFGKRPVES
ncbi:MAG: hypothetical protein WCH99_14750 [Verrucomicrobiota bacterium]